MGTPVSSSAVAGAGTGSTPCSVRTVPEPTLSGEQTTVSIASRSSATAAPTISAMESGKVQYIDGFMRAQFWNAPAPGSPNRTSYFNPLKWSFASALGLPAVPSSEGVVNVVPGTNCETGVVSKIFFNAWIKKYALAPLQDAGIVST